MLHHRKNTYGTISCLITRYDFKGKRQLEISLWTFIATKQNWSSRSMDTIISRLKADNTISYEATNYIKNTDYE